MRGIRSDTIRRREEARVGGGGMDEPRLDTLARVLARLATRRATLKSLIVGVTILAGLGAPGPASAQHHHLLRCRKRRQRCHHVRQCCQGRDPVGCEAIPAKAGCPGQTEAHCCGRAGATCSAEGQGSCGCCGVLRCHVPPGKSIGSCTSA
jgi:hypothetical protein